MKTAVRIVDYGRGPQIEDSRLTVMDVFYYLRRGRDFEHIQSAMPSLTRDGFDAVVEYVNEHRNELIAMDDRVEEWIRKGMAEQEAKGLSPRIDPAAPLEERLKSLRAAMHRHKAMHAERNGDHSPG